MMVDCPDCCVSGRQRGPIRLCITCKGSGRLEFKELENIQRTPIAAFQVKVAEGAAQMISVPANYLKRLENLHMAVRRMWDGLIDIGASTPIIAKALIELEGG